MDNLTGKLNLHTRSSATQGNQTICGRLWLFESQTRVFLDPGTKKAFESHRLLVNVIEQWEAGLQRHTQRVSCGRLLDMYFTSLLGGNSLRRPDGPPNVVVEPLTQGEHKLPGKKATALAWIRIWIVAQTWQMSPSARPKRPASQESPMGKKCSPPMRSF